MVDPTLVPLSTTVFTKRSSRYRAPASSRNFRTPSMALTQPKGPSYEPEGCPVGSRTVSLSGSASSPNNPLDGTWGRRAYLCPAFLCSRYLMPLITLLLARVPRSFNDTAPRHSRYVCTSLALHAMIRFSDTRLRIDAGLELISGEDLPRETIQSICLEDTTGGFIGFPAHTSGSKKR